MNNVQTLPDLKSISCRGSFLEDFVEQFPSSCHIRDVLTQKYLAANQHLARDAGFHNINEIIGFSMQEIWLDETMLMKRNLSQITISDFIKNYQFDRVVENQVFSTKHRSNANRLMLNPDGTIRFENMIKIPVHGQDHKIIAFLSLFLNIISKLSPQKLFSLYQGYYSKKEVVPMFLKHFNLEKCFYPYAPLTCAETRVLIAMRKDARHKAVADQLGCSVPTVSNHIHNIQSKLASGTLHDVLLKLPAVPESE